MVVEIYDKTQQKRLFLADIQFGLDILFVNTFKNLCNSIEIQTAEDLQKFLLERARFKDSYDNDDIVLKKLDLYDRKNEFGRMSEACVLYAMLNNFETEEDDIALYPLKTELVSMLPYDPCYGNIYVWKTRDDA